MGFRPRLLLLFAFAFPSAVFAGAQSGAPAPMVPFAHPDPRLAAIHARETTLHTPGQVAISPDGAMVAYTVRQREGSTLHLIAATNPDPAKERLIAPNGEIACSNSAPVWSPDSQTLAFTSSCTTKEQQPGQSQIFLWSRANGEVRQLTHLTGLFQQAAFSPDGQSLAFLFVENATRSAGALAAMTPWSGVIGQDHVEIQRIAQVEVSSGHLFFITPPALHVYEFAWSPIAQSVTFIAANPPGENNWWVARLYTEFVLKPGLDSRMRIEPELIFDPATTTTALHGLQIAVPRFSPDGKQIAFIGGLMSDQGSTGGDIWTIPATATNNTPTDVTPNIDGTPAWLAWLSNTSIGFVEERRGHTLLVDGSTITKTGISTDDLGEVSVSGGPIKDAISLATNGDLAFVRSGHAVAPEVVGGRLDAIHPLTHLNDGMHSTAHVESINWTNEGFQRPGLAHLSGRLQPREKVPSAGSRARRPFGFGGRGLCQPRVVGARLLRPGSQTPGAASARARSSPPPTARISVTAICATSKPAWTRSKPRFPRSTKPAKVSPAGLTAAS